MGPIAAGDEAPEPHRSTFMQRRALRSLKKQAHKRPDEPLSEEDWAAYIQFGAQPQTRFVKRLMRMLPSTPRCGYCNAPFAGFGARLVRPLGYRPSRKNPSLCASCVEMAPPGGITATVGVLFVDLRGFTARSEQLSPKQASEHLRRFYALTEKVLFPEALIDKLIGDAVMALYLPTWIDPRSTSDRGATAIPAVAELMVAHARELLERAGYGSGRAPDHEMGIGLDLGDAFVGNVGDQAVHDFTAIGDVVNTASRLQSAAAGGEVLLTDRLAAHLDEVPGTPEQLVVKGKQEPVAVHRVRWFD